VVRRFARQRLWFVHPRVPACAIEAADIKVLPLRMTAAEVDALDEAWRQLGFKSRTAMLKKTIAAMLA
jgi:hypothetical protein